MIKQVGDLNIEDKFTWVRNTEEDYDNMDEEMIVRLVKDFNQKYGEDLRLPGRLIEYLAFSSRYWDRDLIKELYMSLFMMKVKKSKKEIIEEFDKNE